MSTIWNRDRRVWIPLQAAFLYFWLVNLQHTDSYYSVYVLVAVASCFAMQQNYQAAPEFSRKTMLSVGIFAAVFSAAVVLANYSLFVPWSAILSLFNAGCTLLGGWVAFGHILLYAVWKFPLAVCSEKRVHPIRIFFTAFTVTAVCYLSYLYFHSYPGLLSRDSLSTIQQILTGEYNNTMPFWHTMTVELFFRVGYAIFGEINAAVAFYLSVQTIFLAACFAYAVMTLYQIGIPWVVLGLIFGGYTILPYHVAYSVTLWKDVLFGGAALLLVTSFYRILRNVGKRQLVNEVLFVLGAVGLSLWRTNGWYALLATALILAIALRKKGKRVLCILCAVLVVCWILISPLLTMLNVPGTDFVEALGIPFQQIARVVSLDCPLTAEETEMLEQLFDLELVKEKYDPQTVDPVKFETFNYGNKDLLKSNMLEYIGLWLRLGIRYPGVYLQAWVETTKGYWNGGYEYWIYMFRMDSNDLNLVHSGGQNPIASVFQALFRYLEKPAILQPLYSIGLHVWLVAICCFLCIKQRRREWVITIPILVLVAGLMLGAPVFAEFRYAYPVFTTAPLIGCVTVFEENRTKE